MRKRLQELTIKNNFMFGAVMCDENNCQGLLERILQIPIERIVVSKEKTIVYHPAYKGIRLDVYANDENGTHYDIEMQALQRPAIEKRSRYYHSQMDMEQLLSGEDYDRLSDSYVIFICDFDPFGEKKYCYTFENTCREDKNLILKDGRKSIFLSTKGENDQEVAKSLVRFLHFVNADLSESEKDFHDEFIENIQKSVKHVKESREMEERFMLFQELLRDERMEGREEGRAEGYVEGYVFAVLSILEEKGDIPKECEKSILEEKDTKVLSRWIKLAAKTESIEQFLKEM